ncbi:peptide deformylase [Lysinibacillus sp. 2017]|uniref:peptide deformylase n=1 Tax=unclassified Lysinibacillus TaxID=2636778 RepID=UPI000D526077|nr:MULTISPECIES: peptide deformylase [unclassified Lysinibacillus]AWE06624.1 peptide deformylase [Lysinibacillus sp. 2017]TGN35339.1 peptide deformylase [Lysinibacillus sp. S2017]
MAIKEVVENPAKVLSQKTKEVEVINDETIQLLDDLYDTMVENDGIGIAAPQINVSLRVAIVELGEDILEMINPIVIETRGEEVEDIEGCLSFPDLFGMVKRPTYVKIEASDREGRIYELEAEDFEARCILHEIDHLDGVLFDSKMTRVLTEEELEELYADAEEE